MNSYAFQYLAEGDLGQLADAKADFCGKDKPDTRPQPERRSTPPCISIPSPPPEIGGYAVRRCDPSDQ